MGSRLKSTAFLLAVLNYEDFTMQKDSEKQAATATDAQRRGCGEGAPPSNTAPANYNQYPKPLILKVGIDSLYLSYPGFIHLKTEIELKRLKELAQGKPEDQVLASYPVLDRRFEVWSKGAGRFPFILKDDCFYIKLSSLGAKTLPLAYVQIGSAFLMWKGIEKAVSELTQIISKVGVIEGEPQVSRVDLYVDFVVDVDFSNPLMGQWVTRARRISTHTIDRLFTGYSIGLGGDISARLYDKTLEIKETGKDYMLDIWAAHGWNRQGTVYRLEFQVERKVLGEHGCKTIPDLMPKLGQLWRYATLNWLKFSVPSTTDQNQSRWLIHPVWEALAMVDWPDTLPGTSKPIRSKGIPDETYLFENGLSGITSFMAINSITDPHDAFQSFEERAKQYHNRKGYFTGQGYDGYMSEKAALKARSYNLNYPGIDEKRDKELREAYAKEYRKLKDGE